MITTHIYDILGFGEPDLLQKARRLFDKRLGKSKAQEGFFDHVGRELPQEKGFSVTLTQEDFAENLMLLSTPPALWGGRKSPMPMDYAKLRQCKMGEL